MNNESYNIAEFILELENDLNTYYKNLSGSKPNSEINIENAKDVLDFNSFNAFYKAFCNKMIENTEFIDTKGENGVTFKGIKVIPNCSVNGKAPQLKDKTSTYKLECGLVGTRTHFDDYQSFLFNHFREIRIQKLNEFQTSLSIGHEISLSEHCAPISKIERSAPYFGIRVFLKDVSSFFLIDFDTLKMKYIVDYCGTKTYL